MTERVTVSFSIPKELKTKIELYAAETRRTQSAVVEMAFEKFLAEAAEQPQPEPVK